MLVAKTRNLVLVSLVFGIVLALPFLLPTSSGNDTKKIQVYVKNAQVPVFARDQTKANIVGYLPKGYKLELNFADPQIFIQNRKKWIYLEQENLLSSDFTPGWVLTSNLLTEKEFKPITKEWPFRYLAYELGDSWIIQYFSKYGRTVDAAGRPDPNRDGVVGRLYSASDIVVIGADIGKKRIIHGAIAIHDKAKNRLCPPGNTLSCDKFFSVPQTWHFGRFGAKPKPVYSPAGTCIVDCRQEQ